MRCIRNENVERDGAKIDVRTECAVFPSLYIYIAKFVLYARIHRYTDICTTVSAVGTKSPRKIDNATILMDFFLIYELLAHNHTYIRAVHAKKEEWHRAQKRIHTEHYSNRGLVNK